MKRPVLAAATLWGGCMASSGGDFIASLPYEVRISTVNGFPGFKSLPYGCSVDGGIMTQFLATLGLDGMEDLQDFLDAISEILGVLGLNSSTKEVSSDNNITDSGKRPSELFFSFVKTAVDEHFSSIPEAPFDSSIPDYWRQHRRRMSTPFVALKALLKEGSPYKAGLEQLISAVQEMRNTTPATDKDTAAPLVDLFNRVEIQEILLRQGTTIPNNIGLRIPDVIIGLITSRLMGQVFDYLASPIENNIMASPGLNLGDGLCSAVDVSSKLDTDPTTFGCALVTLIAGVLGCGTDGPPSCPGEYTSWLITKNECDLVDPPTDGSAQPLVLVPLEEANIEDNVVPFETIDKEGGTLLYLWSASQAANSHMHHMACHYYNESWSDQYIPGWKIKLDLWVRETAGDYTNEDTIEAIPITQVLEGDECNFLIATRGTANYYDWSVDLDASQIPIVLDRNRDKLGIRGHRGATLVHQSMWTEFKDWYGEYVAPRCPRVNFTMTGHSLGGGWTELWALRIADLCDGIADKIESVSFAAMHGLNDEGANFLREKKVNMRSIFSELDLVRALPCDNQAGLPTCNQRVSIGLGGVSGKSKPFGNHVNTFEMAADDMVALHESAYFYKRVNFLSLSLTDLKVGLPTALDILCSHLCSYHCWTSANWCSKDPSKMRMCDYISPVGECEEGEESDKDWPASSCHTPGEAYSYCSII